MGTGHPGWPPPPYITPLNHPNNPNNPTNLNKPITGGPPLRYGHHVGVRQAPHRGTIVPRAAYNFDGCPLRPRGGAVVYPLITPNVIILSLITLMTLTTLIIPIGRRRGQAS